MQARPQHTPGFWSPDMLTNFYSWPRDLAHNMYSRRHTCAAQFKIICLCVRLVGRTASASVQEAHSAGLPSRSERSARETLEFGSRSRLSQTRSGSNSNLFSVIANHCWPPPRPAIVGQGCFVSKVTEKPARRFPPVKLPSL